MQKDRMALVTEAMDRYGGSLLAYSHSLCKNNTVDADVVFDDLFIYAYQRFPKDKLLHYGYYRFKLYQLFTDAWRKEKRRLDNATENLPEKPSFKKHEVSSDADHAAFKRTFFEEHPVSLSKQERDMLWDWTRLGKTYEEISKDTGVPQSTVAESVTRSRAIIAEYVNSQAYNR